MLLKDKKKTAEVVYYLVSMLDKINSAPAKARIIKLIIDFIDYFKTLARETFRRLVKNYIKEKLPVKFQIIQLGVTLMLLNFEDGAEKLEAIFNYVLELGLTDADYGLNQFTRMVKGVFNKEILFGGSITTANAFIKSQSLPPENKNLTAEEFNDVELPHEEEKGNILKDLDNYYFTSLSNILNLDPETEMSLQIDQCSDEQQRKADEFLIRTGVGKDKGEIMSQGKIGESIGFAITNSKGKAVQSIGSEDVKRIEGITKYKNKAKESHAFKDKKQLKDELSAWLEEEDEDEKIS